MDTNLHPGEFLRNTLLDKLHTINVKQVADSLHVNRSQMSAILNSRSLISPLMAVKIELVYCISAETILGLQNKYLIEAAKADLQKLNLDIEQLI